MPTISLRALATPPSAVKSRDLETLRDALRSIGHDTALQIGRTREEHDAAGDGLPNGWLRELSPHPGWLDVVRDGMREPPPERALRIDFQQDESSRLLSEWLRFRPDEAMPVLRDLMIDPRTASFGFETLWLYAEHLGYPLTDEMVANIGNVVERSELSEEIAIWVIEALGASSNPSAWDLLASVATRIPASMSGAQKSLRYVDAEHGRRREFDRRTVSFHNDVVEGSNRELPSGHRNP